MKKYKVYVTYKPGIYDAAGNAAKQAALRLGLDGLTGLAIGKYIQVEGSDQLTLADVEALCDRLLVNPVIEDYRIEVDADAAAC